MSELTRTYPHAFNANVNAPAASSEHSAAAVTNIASQSSSQAFNLTNAIIPPEAQAQFLHEKRLEVLVRDIRH
jgi:hypothetical protein